MNDLSAVIAYISVLFATYNLSPYGAQIKFGLSKLRIKSVALISLSILFVVQFPTVRGFVSNFLLLNETIIAGDIWMLVVWILQLLSIVQIFFGKGLRKGNADKFGKQLHNLISARKRDELFPLLRENIDRIFAYSFKPHWTEEFYQKYCPPQIEILGFDEESFVVTKNKVSFVKKYWTRFLRWLWSPFKYKKRYFDIDKYISNQFVQELALRDENLGYQFIDQYLQYNADYGLREFAYLFLVEVLYSTNTATYSQLKAIDRAGSDMNSSYLAPVIENSSKLGLEGIIDVVIHRLLLDPQNKEILNQSYNPSRPEYNTINKDLTQHLRRLMRIYTLIDGKDINIGMMVYIIEDFIKITNRELFKEAHIYEYTTATYYLISECIDFVEEICDSNNGKYLHIYFAIWSRILGDSNDYGSNKATIPENFKKKIVSSSLYFLCNEYNRKEKITATKEYFGNNKSRKAYFGKENESIDRISHHGGGDIFDAIDEALGE